MGMKTAVLKSALARSISGITETIKDIVQDSVEDLARNVEFSFGGAEKHSIPLGELMHHAANHAVHLKNNRGEFSGHKQRGYTLTNVGMKRGAAIVKELLGTAK